MNCNAKLARLDRAVLDDFEILTFLYGISRKRGKKPVIANRGNITGGYKEGEKTVTINMGSNSIKGSDGKNVGAFGKSSQNIKAAFERSGLTGRISFSQAFGSGRDFVRGIYKIAIESFVYFFGVESILNSSSDWAREYILMDKGERKIVLLQTENDGYKISVKPLHSLKDNSCDAMFIQLGLTSFLVDLTPDMRVFQNFCNQAKKLFGSSGWTYSPLS